MIGNVKRVWNLVKEENVTVGLILFLDEGYQGWVGSGDGEDVIIDGGIGECVDPGPADQETPLEVVGRGGGVEEPRCMFWRCF